MISKRDSEFKELKDSILKLEADLVAAKRFDVNLARARRLEIGSMTDSPYNFMRGTIPIVIAIFLQTAGAVWWASSLSAKVESIQAASEQRDSVIAAMAKTIEENAERLTRVQTVQENVVKILDKLQNVPGH